ncbi:hypothetical protein DPMN_047369 [Dreissena polymorpha]|uniref:Uncharacterized protein n=1 Tax=Dreissena polymorpha TaxID=45954 RepID=A0A9D4D9N5_DREPO|nr:hypothetical protein DPMN_047369 [Dreissena polymorpha]
MLYTPLHSTPRSFVIKNESPFTLKKKIDERSAPASQCSCFSFFVTRQSSALSPPIFCSPQLRNVWDLAEGNWRRVVDGKTGWRLHETLTDGRKPFSTGYTSLKKYRLRFARCGHFQWIWKPRQENKGCRTRKAILVSEERRTKSVIKTFNQSCRQASLKKKVSLSLDRQSGTDRQTDRQPRHKE